MPWAENHIIMDRVAGFWGFRAAPRQGGRTRSGIVDWEMDIVQERIAIFPALVPLEAFDNLKVSRNFPHPWN